MKRNKAIRFVCGIVSVAIILILFIIVNGSIKQYNEAKMQSNLQKAEETKFLLGFNTNMFIHSKADEIRRDIAEGKISSDGLMELDSAVDNISNMISIEHSINIDAIRQFSTAVKFITGEDYQLQLESFFEQMDINGFAAGEAFYLSLNFVDKCYDENIITEKQHTEFFEKAKKVSYATSKTEIEDFLEYCIELFREWLDIDTANQGKFLFGNLPYYILESIYKIYYNDNKFANEVF